MKGRRGEGETKRLSDEETEGPGRGEKKQYYSVEKGNPRRKTIYGEI